MLSSAKILPVFGFLLMLFALIWPAIYNGEPLYFFDTTAYIRGADAGFQKATGVSTPWSLDEGSESSSLVGGEAQAPPPAGLNQIRDQTVISGRLRRISLSWRPNWRVLANNHRSSAAPATGDSALLSSLRNPARVTIRGRRDRTEPNDILLCELPDAGRVCCPSLTELQRRGVCR